MRRPVCRPTARRIPFSLLALDDRINPVSFANGTAYTLPGSGMSSVAGDINGDAVPDVVTGHSSGVTTFLNSGKGALSNPVSMGLGSMFFNFGQTIKLAD